MTVLNLHHHGGRVPEGAVGVMRPSEFGNPFPVGRGFQGLSRAQSVARYRVWLWQRLRADSAFADRVRALHGRDLVCCCAPLACHADVLAAAAAWLAQYPVDLNSRPATSTPPPP